MKRCPTCNRTYADDGQRFCLDDGATLLEDAPASFDPQATIALPGGGQPTNPPQNPYGSGSSGPGSYGSGAGQGSFGSGAGQGSYGSGAGQQQSQQTPSWTPTPQTYPPVPQKSKRKIWPWLLGIGAVLILGFIGLIVAIVLLASNSNSNSNSNNSNNRANGNSNTNSNRSNTNSTPKPAGTVISSTDGKIQITAPTTWRATTGLNEKADLQATDSSNNMYLIILTDVRSNYGSSMTVERHSNETLAPLLKSIISPVETGPTRLTVNGNPAVQHEVRGEIKEGVKVVYLHTTIETPKHYQQIVQWTLQSTYDAKKSVFQDIVQSFKETGD
jgi:hypothetical protein